MDLVFIAFLAICLYLALSRAQNQDDAESGQPVSPTGMRANSR